MQLGRAAPHARQTEERDGGEQSGPEQGRLQEESGRFHPARPCKLTRASLSQTEEGEQSDASEPESVFFESVFVLCFLLFCNLLSEFVFFGLFKAAA